MINWFRSPRWMDTKNWKFKAGAILCEWPPMVKRVSEDEVLMVCGEWSGTLMRTKFSSQELMAIAAEGEKKT